MKNSLLLNSLFILFFIGLSLESQAQIRDSLIFFKAPADIIVTGPDLKLSNSFALPDMRAAQAITKSQAKSLKLPNAVKRLPKVVRLKYGKTCVEMTCDDNCKNCRMYWWDRNNDGKVQPRRELRCICPASTQRCKIKARRTNCR
ncbi:MAG: hypothetical protein AAFP83_13365 [Bacteroidota bacterium]